MKFILMSGLTVIALSLTSPSVASTPAGAQEPVAPEPAVRQPTVVSVIDGIPVPIEVHISIQGKYQGHAVTRAQVVTLNGKEVYRLRVDRDDIPDDFDSIHLYYDMNWQLLDERKMIPPAKPEPPKAAEKPAPAPVPPPAPPQKPDPKPTAPVEGGRGGGEAPKPEPTAPKPEENGASTDDKPPEPKPEDSTTDTSTGDSAQTAPAETEPSNT